jgi:hypothetical protein
MFFRILQIAVPFVWFGMIGAISFMEAPLKFTAPSVTLGLGLGIGRIVFQTLNKIELALAVLMIVSFVVARPRGKFWIYLFGATLVLLVLETVWLLPVLDERALAVIGGNSPPASGAHFVYIAFDAVKFVLLFVLGWILVKQNLPAAAKN